MMRFAVDRARLALSVRLPDAMGRLRSLFWLWWIGVASFNPRDEDIRYGWNYLGLSVVLILSGLAFYSLTRT